MKTALYIIYTFLIATFLIFVTRTEKQSRYHAIVFFFIFIFFFINEHANIKEANQSLFIKELCLELLASNVAFVCSGLKV